MIHSTGTTSILAGPELLIVAGWVILCTAVIYFIMRVGLHIMKMPTEKNLREITDSITNEYQKIHTALEELTKAVRESKEK
mgnify:CR=1 FL=1